MELILHLSCVCESQLIAGTPYNTEPVMLCQFIGRLYGYPQSFILFSHEDINPLDVNYTNFGLVQIALHLIKMSAFQDSQDLQALRHFAIATQKKKLSLETSTMFQNDRFLLTSFCSAGQHWLDWPVCCCICSLGWLMHRGTHTAAKETVNHRREQRLVGHTGCSN